VRHAIRQRDFLNAAKFIQTFFSFDTQVIEDLFRESGFTLDDGHTPTPSTNNGYHTDYTIDTENPITTVSQASDMMRQVQHQLTETLVVEFDNAAKSGDSASIVSTWQLFPLIGRAEMGMQKLSDFWCTMGIRKAVDIPLNVGEKGGKWFDVLYHIHVNCGNISFKLNTNSQINDVLIQISHFFDICIYISSIYISIYI
jgi:hypothetical protein